MPRLSGLLILPGLLLTIACLFAEAQRRLNDTVEFDLMAGQPPLRGTREHWLISAERTSAKALEENTTTRVQGVPPDATGSDTV